MQEQLDRMIEDLNREIDIFKCLEQNRGAAGDEGPPDAAGATIKRQLSAIRLREREARLNLQSVRMAQRSINNVQRMMRPPCCARGPCGPSTAPWGIAQRMGRIFQYVQSQSQQQPQQQNRFQRVFPAANNSRRWKTPTPAASQGTFSRSFSPFRTGVY